MMVVFIITFDLMELEIKQAASDFCKTRSAFSLSASFTIVTVGSRRISVIKNLPSTCSSFPDDLHLKSTNSNLEFSAIAKKYTDIDSEAVLNGIAFKGENMLITGKNWDKIYEVKIK